MDGVTWVVAGASLAALVLNIHGRRACFVIWAATNATWCVVDLHHGIHAQAALQGVYFILSLYGIWKWSDRHGKEDPPRRV